MSERSKAATKIYEPRDILPSGATRVEGSSTRKA